MVYFHRRKNKVVLALNGSKPIDINEIINIKCIFHAGIGKDNVPEKGVVVRYPSQKTKDIIFNETASFTCNLIFRMLYGNIDTLDSWVKEPRRQLAQKSSLLSAPVKSAAV